MDLCRFGREYHAARACSRLDPFVPSFQGSAQVKGKVKTQAWLGLSSERRVESKLGSGSAQTIVLGFVHSSKKISNLNKLLHKALCSI